jgi:nicotinate-nucleotide pyrophosphorylase (carboxylating)
VEVETLDQLREALTANVDYIMLDNFDPDGVRRATSIVRDEFPSSVVSLEVSGGVDETTLVTLAEAGVQRISVGDLTKNITALDLSMRFKMQ